MKHYLKSNVYEAAKKRIEYIFDEFPNVLVTCSGGKDSTVCLELSLEVAKEKNRLPLEVVFIDQEGEWQCVIDYVRTVMDRPEVDNKWLQVPFKIFNAASVEEQWLQCWEEGKEWLRDKEPDAITENVYGTDRFKWMFTKYIGYHYPDTKTAIIGGVRCEESPGRMKGLTTHPTYKHITYGSVQNKSKDHYTFYPIYDWSYTDVWKAIHENKWDYCKLYDYQYQYGIRPRSMRVSSVHHEQSLVTLYYLQEVEPVTWDKLVKRLKGINTAGHLKEGMYSPKELPYMFSSWLEYRDYLLEKITPPEHKEKMLKQFNRDLRNYIPEIHSKLIHMQIECVLANDYHDTKMGVWRAAHGKYGLTGLTDNAKAFRKRVAELKEKENAGNDQGKDTVAN